MGVEKPVNNQTENKEPLGIEKKIHHTHFPVLKIPLQDNSHDSGYEWVDLGNGRFKRMPKKTETSVENDTQLGHPRQA